MRVSKRVCGVSKLKVCGDAKICGHEGLTVPKLKTNYVDARTGVENNSFEDSKYYELVSEDTQTRTFGNTNSFNSFF